MAAALSLASSLACSVVAALGLFQAYPATSRCLLRGPGVFPECWASYLGCLPPPRWPPSLAPLATSKMAAARSRALLPLSSFSAPVRQPQQHRGCCSRCPRLTPAALRGSGLPGEGHHCPWRKDIFIMESRLLNMCFTVDSLRPSLKDCTILSKNMLWKWEVYTIRGIGSPCAFPFKFKNRWYHECINEGRSDGAYWCSTTMLYDRDGQWGFCPSSDIGCNGLWEENKDRQTCYQFNLDSLLPWHKARSSCQAQGGDLLSISDVTELQLISDYLKKSGFWGDLYWTGLNQLNEGGRWQWSDGAPLSLVNWKSSFTYFHSEEHQCGVSNAMANQTWQNYGCHLELPYVCKKQIVPRNHTTFEEKTWMAASDACHSNGSELMSVTSLADVELVLKLLQNENVSEAWIGLNSKTRNPFVFQWSDGSPVTFTNWHRHEPSVSQAHGGLCVSVLSIDGSWKVENCSEKMFYVCKKKGLESESMMEEDDCQKSSRKAASPRTVLVPEPSVSRQEQQLVLGPVLVPEPSVSTQEQQLVLGWVMVPEPSASHQEQQLVLGQVMVAEPSASLQEQQLVLGLVLVPEPSASLQEQQLVLGLLLVPEPSASPQEQQLVLGLVLVPEPSVSPQEQQLVLGRVMVPEPSASHQEQQLVLGQVMVAEPSASLQEQQLVLGLVLVPEPSASPQEQQLVLGLVLVPEPSASPQEQQLVLGRCWSLSPLPVLKNSKQQLVLGLVLVPEPSDSPQEKQLVLGLVLVPETSASPQEQQLVLGRVMVAELSVSTQKQQLVLSSRKAASPRTGAVPEPSASPQEQQLVLGLVLVPEPSASPQEKLLILGLVLVPEPSASPQEQQLVLGLVLVPEPSASPQEQQLVLGRVLVPEPSSNPQEQQLVLGLVLVPEPSASLQEQQLVLGLVLVPEPSASPQEQQLVLGLVLVPETLCQSSKTVACPRTVLVPEPSATPQEQQLVLGWVMVAELSASLQEKQLVLGRGWERHGAYCYKIDDFLRTFEHASSGYYCASSLATIINRFEQAFVSSMISSKMQTKGVYFWIALQDQNNTGEYTWMSNSTHQLPVTYTNWAKYQPSRQGGCVAMQNVDSFGRWVVKDCKTAEAMSLCKKPLTSVIEKPLTSDLEELSSDTCYDWDSESYLDHCYKVFHHEKVLRKRTWEEAEDFCQGYGGHLVSFSHIDEEHFVRDLLRTMFRQNEERQFWIGFNKRNPTSGGSWDWSDETAVVSSFLEDMYVSAETKNCASIKANKKVIPLYCDTKLEWICKIPKGGNMMSPVWHIKEIPWVYFHGHEYFFYNSNTEFEGFQFVCGWMRSQLVTILSSAEQAFIQRRIKKFSRKNQNWWMGLMYENARDGFQRWGDGRLVEYSNWETLPTNVEDLKLPQCAYISSQTGLWGYTECSASLPAICKTNKILKVENENVIHGNEIEEPKHGQCPAGWLYYGYKCFYVHTEEKDVASYDWFSASSYCQTHDGDLASIKNELEQAFIVMQLFGQTEGFWLRFKEQDYEDWANETSYTYANWSPFAVTQFEDNDTCALISTNHNFHLTGKWYLDNCHQKGYGFVCEKEQAISPNMINASDMYPLPDIIEYGHKTYLMISGNMSWFDASSKCQEHEAELVSIIDQYYQAFLTVVVNRLGYAHWIGFFKQDNGRHFGWADNSGSLFTAWDEEGSLSDGNCAYMDIDGYWRSLDCNAELPGAICLFSNNSKLPDNDPKCLETWRRFQDHCYSFSSVLNKTDFYTSQEICEKQGSSLLRIVNEEEEAFIAEELEPFSSVQMIWLDNVVFHNFSAVWSDGTTLNYSNWLTEKPGEDSLNGELCLSMRLTDGSWLFTHCNERRGFVCKTHKDYRKDQNRPFSNIKRTNHVIVPVYVIMSLTLLVVLLAVWFFVRKNKRLSCTPDLLKLHYAQFNAQATENENNILITAIDSGSEKELNKLM
ncbi:secretory phospholipase A2 receptor-like [Discoglossus pictus]